VKASAGDRILIAAAALGKPVRDGEILEVRGPLGTPPYLVAWSDGGAHTLFFPGPDAQLEHYAHEPEDLSEADWAPPSVSEAHPPPGQHTRRHA